MFQTEELARLREQKERLVLQSEANRRRLAEDWQRLRSPVHWLGEAGRLARSHPIWTASLAAAAGMLAVQALRKPGALFGGVGRFGKLASVVLTAWRLFGNKPKT